MVPALRTRYCLRNLLFSSFLENAQLRGVDPRAPCAKPRWGDGIHLPPDLAYCGRMKSRTARQSPYRLDATTA